MEHRMLKIFFALAFVCALPAAAQAKTLKLGDKPPVAEITVPDGWESDVAEGDFEASASDIYLSGDVVEPRELRDATTAVEQFLAEHKVKLKTETKTQKAVKIAGLTAVESAWAATDADGPTKVSVDLVKLSETKLLLVTYWRSEAGEKAHGAEAEAILASLKPLK